MTTPTVPSLEATADFTHIVPAPTAKLLSTVVELADTSEFGMLLSAAAKAKFFTFLLEQVGTYLFSTMLILKIAQFLFKAYDYATALNKDITKKSSLLWSALQLGFIATAIIGTLLAVTAFTLITPVLFVISLALDTLRNAALTVWNTYLYNKLYFKSSINSDDPLDAIKREALRRKYNQNIKEHAKGTIIGAILTLGAAIIFLFPKIGLAGVATASFVAGGLKLSVAGIAGIISTTALLAPIVVPIFVNLLHKIANVVKLLVQRAKSFMFKQNNSYRPLAENTTEIEPSLTEPVVASENVASAQPALINNEKDLEKTNNATFKFESFTYRSKFREIIITNMADTQSELAKNYLLDEIKNKVDQLSTQIDAANADDKNWFEQKVESAQTAKRQQKIQGLEILREAIEKPGQNTAESKGHIEAVIMPALKSEYKELYDNVILVESDCANIIKAALLYERKFKPYASKLDTAPQLILNP